MLLFSFEIKEKYIQEREIILEQGHNICSAFYIIHTNTYLSRDHELNKNF